MGPQIQWVRSFVCDDKIYCEYLAPDEQQIRQHAESGGFPANSVKQVMNVIDPATALETASDLINQAGGLLEKASKRNITITRRSGGSRRDR